MYKIVVRTLVWNQNLKVTFFRKRGLTKESYTKFRFKFVADLCCWIFNKGDDSFSSYKVVKID